tara:strand:- start:36661 stop:37158 length:498 start_codon:yes stop_codon:yes gene_type:complete
MSEETSPTTTLPKNEMKKATKEHIASIFQQQGCVIIQRSAGAVGYQALRFTDSKHNVACVYGGRGVAASIWVKAPVLDILKANLHVTATTHNVEDVSFFKRGLDWKIDIQDLNDPAIAHIVKACVDNAKPHYEAEMLRESEKQERLIAQAAKRELMDAKRKDPFA